MAKRNEPRWRSPRHTTATHRGIYSRALFILYWPAFGLHRSQNSRGTRGVCPRPRVLPIVTSSKSLRQEARKRRRWIRLPRSKSRRLSTKFEQTIRQRCVRFRQQKIHSKQRRITDNLAFLLSNGCRASVLKFVWKSVVRNQFLPHIPKLKNVYIIFFKMLFFFDNICF